MRNLINLQQTKQKLQDKTERTLLKQLVVLQDPKIKPENINSKNVLEKGFCPIEKMKPSSTGKAIHRGGKLQRRVELNKLERSCMQRLEIGHTEKTGYKCRRKRSQRSNRLLTGYTGNTSDTLYTLHRTKIS